jgi:hypothetical protein
MVPFKTKLERGSMPRPTGRILNDDWGVGARHALYRKTGDWYMPLTRFPGALCDENGYVVFATKEDYERSPYLGIGVRVDVPSGIANIPGYVRATP